MAFGKANDRRSAWHRSGPHFRDYHLLLDEQADQIFATIDAIAERSARSAERPCDPSATSAGCNAS
jgi:DNA-binding ferritin-like protein